MAHTVVACRFSPPLLLEQGGESAGHGVEIGYPCFDPETKREPIAKHGPEVLRGFTGEPGGGWCGEWRDGALQQRCWAA